MTDTTILTSMVKRKDESTNGITMVNLSGEPYAAAIVNAMIGNYHRFSGRPRVDQQMLEELVGEKVTLVLSGENMIGSGMVIAREGRLFQGSSGIAVMPKGKRSKGYRVDPGKVLDVFEGWVDNEVAEFVAEIRGSRYPELVNLTQERLEQLPGENQGTGDLCRLAVFGSNPLFGATDCVWLIGEYWPEDDICDRNVLLIRPEFGTSESGSCYGRDLLRNRSLGEIVGFEPIPFGRAIKLCDLDFDEALERIVGRTLVA